MIKKIKIIDKKSGSHGELKVDNDAWIKYSGGGEEMIIYINESEVCVK